MTFMFISWTGHEINMKWNTKIIKWYWYQPADACRGAFEIAGNQEQVEIDSSNHSLST